MDKMVEENQVLQEIMMLGFLMQSSQSNSVTTNVPGEHSSKDNPSNVKAKDLSAGESTVFRNTC